MWGTGKAQTIPSYFSSAFLGQQLGMEITYKVTPHSLQDSQAKQSEKE